MKISIRKLIEAQKIAEQREYLAEQRKKLRLGGTVTEARARVVLQPRATAKTKPVTVEISENGQGEIAQAILDCIERNLDQRIETLDIRLDALGIDIEDDE